MDIEQEIQSKNLNAPRITPAHIENVIVGECFFSAAQGVIGSGNDVNSDDDPLRLLTFCVLTLKNGFTVTGESACASPENYNWEIGCKIARANAFGKIWPLEGYLLKERLSEPNA